MTFSMEYLQCTITVLVYLAQSLLHHALPRHIVLYVRTYPVTSKGLEWEQTQEGTIYLVTKCSLLRGYFQGLMPF
jgi:hypothetical protein